MVFSSIEFISLFLPAFLLVQALIPYRNLTYVLFSLLFYFAGEGWYAGVVVVSVLVNYGLGLLVDAQTLPARRKLALTLGVALNLASLTFFKYTGFLWTSVLHNPGSAWVTSIHLPLGISFFTFHAISYLVDIYRRDVKAERSVVDLALYMLMFPQLVAGPILRFHTVSAQLKERAVLGRHVHHGMLLFCVGLGQKVLIADTLATLADASFDSALQLTRSAAWLGALAYTGQILFDFSGYSNMAIGLGWLTGFSLPRNFDEPYSARSVTEFWRRWHMSLSRWFRDYLYVPLGGNRHGAARTYINLTVVFLICGLWHGAAWTFVFWGAYHGAWLVIERLGWGRVLARLPRVLQHAYTLLIVIVGWVVFRSNDLAHAGRVLSAMFLPTPTGTAPTFVGLTNGQALALAGAGLLCIPSVAHWLRSQLGVIVQSPLPERIPRGSFAFGACAALVVFGLAAMQILAGAYSSFIYFRF